MSDPTPADPPASFEVSAALPTPDVDSKTKVAKGDNVDKVDNVDGVYQSDKDRKAMKMQWNIWPIGATFKEHQIKLKVMHEIEHMKHVPVYGPKFRSWRASISRTHYVVLIRLILRAFMQSSSHEDSSKEGDEADAFLPFKHLKSLVKALAQMFKVNLPLAQKENQKRSIKQAIKEAQAPISIGNAAFAKKKFDEAIIHYAFAIIALIPYHSDPLLLSWEQARGLHLPQTELHICRQISRAAVEVYLRLDRPLFKTHGLDLRLLLGPISSTALTLCRENWYATYGDTIDYAAAHVRIYRTVPRAFADFSKETATGVLRMAKEDWKDMDKDGWVHEKCVEQHVGCIPEEVVERADKQGKDREQGKDVQPAEATNNVE